MREKEEATKKREKELTEQQERVERMWSEVMEVIEMRQKLDGGPKS